MHPNLEALPTRVRKIAVEEIVAHALVLGPGISNPGRVLSNDLHRKVSQVRDAIWFRMREQLQTNGEPVSYPYIGSLFGRDHTSVMAGVKRHKARMAEWAEIKQRHYELQRRTARADLQDA